jgi:membrane associated rhomboid family serine protease
MNGDFARQLEASPVSYLTLFAYGALAILTNALDPSGPLMVRYGAAAPVLVQDGDWWRLLTNAYLHWGLIHLLLNGYALWLFGPGLERTLGSVRFAVLYVVSAVSGSATAMLFTHPLGILAGGSGALFGMLGAMLALVARSGRTRLAFLRHHFARSLLSLIAINLVLGWVIPAISNSAHVGGLISGFVLVYAFLDTGRERVDGVGRAIQAGWVAVLLALTCYALFPVLRWDYQLDRSRNAATAEERTRFARAVGRVTPRDVELLRTELRDQFGERGDRLWRDWFR